MEKIEIKIGDKFVYNSKYGGLIQDTIEDIRYSLNINTSLKAVLKKYHIKSSKGVWYDFDEIEIVDEFMSEKGIAKITKMVKEMREKKEEFREKVKNNYYGK